MAKQVIIAALEEVIGEYVLNLDKENLKIAALQGKIKLENVQLDGDVLGGHILGSIGLSGFGILSCWATSVVITVPLKNLENDVTKIEMTGCHLLCLPLLPATAHQAYGAGNNLDPRCTLRTRAKRAKLVRFEKNFLQGRFPGEGPVARKILRAVREVERDQRKRRRQKQQQYPTNGSNSLFGSTGTTVSNASSGPFVSSTDDCNDMKSGDFGAVFGDDLDDINGSDDNYESSVGDDQSTSNDDEEKSSKSASLPEMSGTTDLPQVPRDWKVKLREKVMRNMEASMHDIHVRCEVFEGGLDFCHPDYRNPLQQEKKQYRKHEYDQRSFAFGATLETFVMRTANEKWKVGSHEKKRDAAEKDHLGPNPYDARHNKLHTWKNFNIYWDLDPSFLISESEIIRTPGLKISSDKFHSKIAAAMQAMVSQQEPGPKVRQSLVVDWKRYRNVKNDSKRENGYEDFSPKERLHQYICKDFDCRARQKMSDRTQPGPISCQAEFLPFQLDFKFRPHQFVQYQKLKSAMLSQQRFDTMLRQRPTESPKENPRAWWKYAFSCVTTRPNSRPWYDVVQIVRGRDRYITLVTKRLNSGSGGSGFHRGLSDAESTELLKFEDLLPIEALLAFHLLALRRYVSGSSLEREVKGAGSDLAAASQNLATGRGRKLGGGSLTRIFKTRPRKRATTDIGFRPLESDNPPLTEAMGYTISSRAPTTPKAGIAEATSMTLLEAMTVRLGKKVWFVHFKIFHAAVTVTLLSASDEEIVVLSSEMTGTIKYLGKGKMDFFVDISRFEAADCQSRDQEKGRLLVLHSFIPREAPMSDENDALQDDNSTDLSADLALTPSFTGDDLKKAISFMDLPPPGVVCRLAAVRDDGTTKLSFASHPATLVWTRQCFDAVAEFFGAPSTKMQTELASHLKHVATPLARKAQLAFLSQSTLILHVNIAAPKIWVPFLSTGSSGALCFDAGNLKYSYKKEEGRANVSWMLETNAIQVNFARWHLSQVREKMVNLYNSTMMDSSRQQGVNSIVRPFQVMANGGMSEKQLATKLSSGDVLAYTGSVRHVDISISAIAMNLVDAEVLARAFGKWYSRGLLGFRGQSASKFTSRYYDQAAFSNTYEIQERAMRNFQSRNSTPHCLSLNVEKIEVALEGHSKQIFSDEKSMESHETSQFGQYASPTRTYVVEVFQLRTSRTKNHDIIATKVTLADTSIVQLTKSSDYSPMSSRHEAQEPQYCILERGLAPGDEAANEGGTSVLSISMLHDGTVHLDEVEIDVEPVILRVTPTSLKDCTKGIRKIVEIGQVLTREMERKVHEEGRRARQRNRNHTPESTMRSSDLEIRPLSPASFTSEMSLSQMGTERSDRTATNSRAPLDSSLIVKLTLKDGCLLAGRPTFSSESSRPKTKIQRTKLSYSFAVVQVVSNSLIMFQSVENADASGSKTLHVSFDNLCGGVDTEFEKMTAAQASPMIGPTGAEFRFMNITENFGWSVSNDVSLDCEHLRTSLTPNDLSILISIVDIMVKRLRGIHTQIPESRGLMLRKESRGSVLSSILRYQKKGTGIATNIRVELQRISFVVLRTFESKYGAPEFLSFNLKDFKTRLSGCMSALAGECFAIISVDFYNPEISEWEEVVENFPMKLLIDQMPNELVIDASTSSSIQLNLTGILLRDFSDFDAAPLQKSKDAPFALTPSALSTVGLRRATETHLVEVLNHTGVDIEVDIEEPPTTGKKASVRFDSIGPGVIKNNGRAAFDSLFDGVNLQQNLEDVASQTPKMTIRFPPSSVEAIGEREPIRGLHVVSSSGNSTVLCLLSPDSLLHITSSHHERSCLTPSRRTLQPSHFNEDDSVLTSNSVAPDYAYYHAEPVVEWCMQNQRLRSSTIDLYSLEKGRDLLSSGFWSPEEDYNVASIPQTHTQGMEMVFEGTFDENDEEVIREAHGGNNIPVVKPLRSNWLRPYLKNDSPEWTDMTCILRMARERVMLPDNNWMWVNDWTVDVSGEYGESTDADGYEYSEDFETFSRARRFYERGDSCRRRRWTRTRIVRPPRLDDPNRILKLVWETRKNDRGNFVVDVKSHVSIHNSTSSELSFFVYSPSWDEEKFVGTCEGGDRLCVPINFASAVYLRLAKRKSNKNACSLNNFDSSDRVMMLPTGHNSNVLVRSSIKLNDVSHTNLHFLLEIKSRKGIVTIAIEPVLKILSLLPCLLECQLGEVLRPSERRQVDNRPVISGQRGKKFRIANVETLSIESGKEGKCVALNPGSKPHISLRVPGYRWSAWQRIVNRRANSSTWRPSEAEEDIHINSNKGDADFVEEFKTIVHFDRLGKSGDPLVLIISVEAGHSPTLRVYSQYWILDKTGFGCRFCESFSDILGTVPDTECSRRTHLLKEESIDPCMKKDLKSPGYRWSVGCNGMTMYHSPREKIAMAIESISDENAQDVYAGAVRSKWTSPMDISNVMPKTVFSVDELSGQRRFELAISVTMCPGIFGRTKLITFIPRYQVVNLLKRELVIAQDGCLKSELLIASRSAVSFHWERRSLPPKVRLGTPTMEEKDSGIFDGCWTNGCIQLDKVGITSMRLPTTGILPSKPMVVQAEVRLAAKEQNSAVVIVIWSANERSNPLYLLRNLTQQTIICRQPLQEDYGDEKEKDPDGLDTESEGRISHPTGRKSNGLECGQEIGPIVRSILGFDRLEEYVWVLRSGDVACFGFDDPEKPHILEWSCVDHESFEFEEKFSKAFVEIDAMGSSSRLRVGKIMECNCQIKAEHSTKVVEFSDCSQSTVISEEQNAVLSMKQDIMDNIIKVEEEEDAAFSLRVNIPAIAVSVVDNAVANRYGREILLAQFDGIFCSFSQSREGYHEIEFRLISLQIDNHVPVSIHPVLVFCPKQNDKDPFIHLSGVRRLQDHSTTYVFRYAAFRMLEVNIFLDRMTAETIARFIEPCLSSRSDPSGDSPDFVSRLTASMTKNSGPDRHTPADISMSIHSANSGRIYFEQLHLHPIRISLTFTQEWVALNQGNESFMVFQFIRGMASIADAPLTFTSFVVSHVFESPQTLLRVVGTHYSSQLTKQIFAILGSLAILGAPADFISNVGTGVRDFFYEPIQGAVHGPRQFIEGLEAGTQSLARGVFVGVVRGAANVAEIVNHNLALASADDDFIDERKAHQRILTDAMSRGVTSRKFSDSMYLAAASVARGVRSGALGIVEQPARYAAKHGPIGLVKGVGKAVVGVVVKPIVGVGDAAALLMNHVSDITSNKQVIPKIPKRLRRALPSRSIHKPNCVILKPFDDRAAKAQKIVTGGESCDDVYIGHVNIPSHLIIASEQCLWAIDRRSRDAWCVSWEEISHFGRVDGGIRVVVFSQTGLKPYVFQVEEKSHLADFQKILTMHHEKMGNASSNLAMLRTDAIGENDDIEISMTNIPGIKGPHGKYVFGSCNNDRKRLASSIKDEIDVIEQCFGRVKRMGSEMPKYFVTLDEEAWTLVSCWGQVFSGLSSRRCIAASLINGTGEDIQIKSTKLLEGGSPCYSIPTKEFDADHGVLRAGGVIIFFGWSQQPSLLQQGNVFMHIETNAFTADLAHVKSRDIYAEAFAGYELGFLEKSFDDHGWWAKYWLLIRKRACT